MALLAVRGIAAPARSQFSAVRGLRAEQITACMTSAQPGPIR